MPVFFGENTGCICSFSNVYGAFDKRAFAGVHTAALVEAYFLIFADTCLQRVAAGTEAAVNSGLVAAGMYGGVPGKVAAGIVSGG